MKTKFILFVLIGILAVSCKKESSNSGVSTQPEISINNPEFKEIKKDNYSITVHKDWYVEHGQNETSLSIYLDTEDDFSENINVIITDLPSSSTTLKDIETSAKKEFLLIKGSVISSEKIITPNKEYQRMVVIAPNYGENLKYLIHYIIKNSKLYILTFTAHEKDFEQYEKIAEQVMQSFRV